MNTTTPQHNLLALADRLAMIPGLTDSADDSVDAVERELRALAATLPPAHSVDANKMVATDNGQGLRDQPEYRFLQRGEVMQDGDQFQTGDTWTGVGAFAGQQWQTWHKPVRRLATHPPQQERAEVLPPIPMPANGPPPAPSKDEARYLVWRKVHLCAHYLDSCADLKVAVEVARNDATLDAALDAALADQARRFGKAAAPAAPATPDQHPDDLAVDRFAAAMKSKLAAARAKGRGGWEDKADCTQQDLSDMLRAHVEKGDPRDVANFCMFLHQRGEGIAAAATPESAEPVALPMESAPKDGTLVRLLVEFEENAIDDTEAGGPCWTVGANTADHSDFDEWEFAGWSWEQDHFTKGYGKPIGWLPFHAGTHPTPAASDGGLREADAIALLRAIRGGKAWQQMSEGWRALASEVLDATPPTEQAKPSEPVAAPAQNNP